MVPEYKYPLPQILGIMIAGKADVFSIRDWLFRHHRLFDKLVIVDGSKSDYIANLAKSHYHQNVVVLKEETLQLTTISDQTLRGPAMTVLGNPVGSWIMICHADEFWTIDPRRLVMENDKEEDQNGWTNETQKHNVLRFPVLTASPYESRYQMEVEKIKADPKYWQEGDFHILHASNMTHGYKSSSNLVRDYFENRIFRWQDGMAWGTRNGLVVPEHIPLGQKIRYYRDAFFVHFKLHDFSADGSFKGKSGGFKNSNLRTGTRDERAEGWMGSFLDVSYPEQVAQFPPRNMESALLERCVEFANRRWPCELGWNVNATFT
ncbi:unnamed protein product [Cylindrotheca closterium]|uniref:Uncharacterized protein n=1 Tax=Cylindrotheca closterium TaxID=2856 RepID=A0AAD2FF82_9STRA|nr:unnamed protein product [Cylindrotheca closterium]